MRWEKSKQKKNNLKRQEGNLMEVLLFFFFSFFFNFSARCLTRMGPISAGRGCVCAIDRSVRNRPGNIKLVLQMSLHNH